MPIYLFTMFLLCCTPAAVADEIKLVTGNDYPPFTDESLPQRGMLTEIVSVIFSNLGYEPVIDFRPWKRGYAEAESGQYAATFPYIQTESRKQEFYYSDPIHKIHTRIFVRVDSEIENLEALRHRRICTPLGYGVTKRFDDFLRENTVERREDPADLAGCFKMIASGRKDFLIINEINGWITIRDTFSDRRQFRTLDTIFEEETHHLIISKQYPDAEILLQRFNGELAALKKSGGVQKIMDRHLSTIMD